MDLLTLFEYFGIIAFSLSSAVVAIEYKLDLFGILVLAVTTSVGGGMIRDIILNITPPIMFVKPMFCIIATVTAIIVISVFAVARRLRFHHSLLQNMNVIKALITIFDAIGLGIFTVLGTDIAITHGYGSNTFLVVFVGTITGVGGGILRDILVSRKPVLLSKEVYALAAIAGSIAFVYLRPLLLDTFAVYLCAALIAAIRLISVYANINLPQLKKLEL